MSKHGVENVETKFYQNLVFQLYILVKVATINVGGCCMNTKKVFDVRVF